MKSYPIHTFSAVVFFCALFSFSGCATSATSRLSNPELEAKNTARLDQLKELEGQWAGTNHHGDEPSPIAVTYRVTAGGNSVIETIAPGTEMEMVTLYNMDGSDLVLTHYCILNNQPKMVARNGGAPNEIRFKFVACGNLKSPKDDHMHTARFVFVDKNTLTTEWTMYKDGDPQEPTLFELKRVKS